MVIDVKATKAKSEADPSERYALKSMDKNSNLPILLGGFATCVVVYVKSLFMEGGARPEQPAPPPEGSDQGPNRSVKLQLVSNTDDLTGSSGPSSDAPDSGKEQSTFAVRWASGAVDLADETPLKFLHANLRSNWDAFAV